MPMELKTYLLLLKINYLCVQSDYDNECSAYYEYLVYAKDEAEAWWLARDLAKSYYYTEDDEEEDDEDLIETINKNTWLFFHEVEVSVESLKPMTETEFIAMVFSQQTINRPAFVFDPKEAAKTPIVIKKQYVTGYLHVEHNILDEFKKAFPGVRVKDGKDFDGGDAVLWSGEGSEVAVQIDGEMLMIPAFDYYSTSEMYEFGVHRLLVQWAARHGLEWECHDPGTFLVYNV